MEYSLKIGLVPICRDVANVKTRTGAFRASSAVENKEKAVGCIKENFSDEITEFVDLEWLNDEGLLFVNNDGDKAKEASLGEKVDEERG